MNCSNRITPNKVCRASARAILPHDDVKDEDESSVPRSRQIQRRDVNVAQAQSFAHVQSNQITSDNHVSVRMLIGNNILVFAATLRESLLFVSFPRFL